MLQAYEAARKEMVSGTGWEVLITFAKRKLHFSSLRPSI
jgi:hypothetical protein